MTDNMTTMSDLVQSKYNAKVRVKAAKRVIHPQFFTRENAEEKTKSAVFTVFSKLSADPSTRTLTTSYTENDDSMSESQVTITATEYGNALGTLQGLRTTSFMPISPVVEQLISINMAETLDNAAAEGIYNGLSVNSDYGTVAGALTPELVDIAITDLEDNSIPAFPNGLFAAIISPRTKRDLFGANDLKGFIPVTLYANAKAVYNRELGAWLGIRWVVGASAYNATSEGQRHDYPIIFGYNAFGQANGYAPKLVFKEGTDDLKRRNVNGWKGQRGYGVVDSDSCRQFDVLPSALAA